MSLDKRFKKKKIVKTCMSTTLITVQMRCTDIGTIAASIYHQ